MDNEFGELEIPGHRRGMMHTELSNENLRIPKRVGNVEGQLEQRYPDWRTAILPASEALFSLNRYAKWKECSTELRSEIYGLKNAFLQLLYKLEYCDEARSHVVVCQRQMDCHKCRGEGIVMSYSYDDEADDDEWITSEEYGGELCPRCDGTGYVDEAREVEFIAFRFSVGANRYSWHQPKYAMKWDVPVAGGLVDWEPETSEKPVKLEQRQFSHAKDLLRYVLSKADSERVICWERPIYFRSRRDWNEHGGDFCIGDYDVTEQFRTVHPREPGEYWMSSPEWFAINARSADSLWAAVEEHWVDVLLHHTWRTEEDRYGCSCPDILHYALRDAVSIARAVANYCGYSIEVHILKWLNHEDSFLRKYFQADDKNWEGRTYYNDVVADLQRYRPFWVRHVSGEQFEIRDDCQSGTEWTEWNVDRLEWAEQEKAEQEGIYAMKELNAVIYRIQLCRAIAKHLDKDDFAVWPHAPWVQKMPDNEETRALWKVATELCGLDRPVCYKGNLPRDGGAFELCDCPAQRRGRWIVFNANTQSLWAHCGLDLPPATKLPARIRKARRIAEYCGIDFECDPERWKSHCGKKTYQKIVQACRGE